MTPCTFCSVAAGALPAHRVAEDGEVVAFLDVHPLFPGHTLLVPRLHVRTLADLPPERVGHFFAVAQRLQRAVEAGTGSEGTLILVNNVVSQSVPHLHLHVIPRRRGDGLRRWLGPRLRYPDEAAAAGIADRIRAALEPA